MRADARRILIVAPGSLVEQWRDELFEKFGLEFRVFSTELEQASPSGNPFDDHRPAHRPARSDGAQRGPAGQALRHAGWDLVVFDEAHKLVGALLRPEDQARPSASSFAEELGRTRATCC